MSLCKPKALYVQGLNQLGVRLLDKEDEIVWIWNRVDGQITAKSANDTISFLSSEATGCWWSSTIWKWNLPMKLKCFLWLMLKNKVLTWDNLVKRGRMGPGNCCLWLCYSGSVDHLFVQCSFAEGLGYYPS